MGWLFSLAPDVACRHRSEDEARDTFKMLKSQLIGDSFAYLYSEWAMLEDLAGEEPDLAYSLKTDRFESNWAKWSGQPALGYCLEKMHQIPVMILGIALLCGASSSESLREDRC